MKKYRIKINGMTCTGCEQHIDAALTNIGALNIETSFRRGESVFEIPDDVNAENVRQAIKQAKYQPEDIEDISTQKLKDIELDIKSDYDLLIIGSGGAAFSAAIKSIEYGAKVGMIERGTVGGTCVNVGCVPSKTLLRAGEINHIAKANPFIGLQTSVGEVDLASLVKQKDELVSELRNQKYIDLIDEYGIDLIKGEAKFIDENTVEVNGEKHSAKRFLIATGASPSIPTISGLEEVDYITSTTLLELKKMPKRLTVMGSGYIGLELGQLFHNLGSEVTLIQRSDCLLKEYDPEISEAVEKVLTEQGINLLKGATYERVEQVGAVKKVYVTVDGKKKVVESEQLLVATGRKPNTDSLNLSAAGVEVGKRNEILINDYARTSNQKIYAAGDVTLGPQFVYVAAYEGGVVADNAIGGLNKKLDLSVFPAVTFINPSIATVGLTEKKAKEQGYEVKTSVLSLDSVPRALVNRETTGVFKVVADAKTLKILGVHIVSENAGDVIYAATLAVKFGLTVEDLKDSLAPYLTMAEGLRLTALTFDKDVSKLSCCAG
ncbi:mercury(II) reductase [Heyndrickxia sporothermodurans]|uniref:Mercuric reductase n=3 Tax=Bacillaceae TaxID=186817 RepID=A0AB37HQA4_9BACI|nr:mercury(II) reductase [Heyndrickxia sporothermodurans]MBL5767365.1 mercury(II) reductase [Heyndrickxia sporothermodurans]MBL5770838.1 mercury(II) reductase [Heyndrickxia sporothermodurans]MBL5774478.1 mercury(II) reductase [Heyndrickxia sporothermodurans]MBL5779558.1 mercury(II) reductase [Heyndrickxia sporothermodurans]MBL5785206.1 mercury(II) reductase [Heyndrickxia sporothermodurans]